jgi:hypothetical protein
MSLIFNNLEQARKDLNPQFVFFSSGSWNSVITMAGIRITAA